MWYGNLLFSLLATKNVILWKFQLYLGGGRRASVVTSHLVWIQSFPSSSQMLGQKDEEITLGQAPLPMLAYHYGFMLP